jgi:hypothetical protein
VNEEAVLCEQIWVTISEASNFRRNAKPFLYFNDVKSFE